MTRNDLLRLSNRELMQVLRDGHPIPAGSLDDTAYRGISLGLPAFIEKLSWKTFQKTFHRDPRTGVLRGWNVRIEQRGLDSPSVARQQRGVPWTWGHYHVIDAPPVLPRVGRSRGLLIHYGLGANPRFAPLRRMRDPLVAVSPGSADLLLGWSYLDFGAFALGTPSFFALEREAPLAYVPPA